MDRGIERLVVQAICLLLIVLAGCSSSGDTRRDGQKSDSATAPVPVENQRPVEPEIPAGAVAFHRYLVDREGGTADGYDETQEELEDEPELGTHRLVCRGRGVMKGEFAPTAAVVKDPPRLIAHADSAIAVGTLKGSHTISESGTLFHVEWDAVDLYNAKIEETHYRE